MAEVTLEHVDKRYANGVVALRDFTLNIADGELVVLVGSSASGKTTTLRVIAGLEELTGGAIRIGGHLMKGVAPRHRNVALVFQRHSLYPHLNIRDNLAFGLRLREERNWLGKLMNWADEKEQARQRDARVLEAAHLLGLEGVLDRKPYELSGGQQQRAALGRALVRQPAVFLLDEPLSHLDPPLRAELRRELHLLQKRLRATMLYVTHDQAEALSLGHRIVVLDGGVIQQVGTPAEVYARPRNRFVAGFIGWPPMNLLEATLEHHEGALRVRVANMLWPLPEPAKRLAKQTSREVTLGIRPAVVTLVPTDQPGALAMEVILCEFLGKEYLLTLKRDIMRLKAMVDADQCPRVGQTVGVSFDMRDSHLFDRASGASLNRAEPDG